MLFSFPIEKFTEKQQRQFYLRRIFRRVFLEDWGTKLIALAISFTLWLGISGLSKPTTNRVKNVSLIMRISNEMEMTNTPLKEVDIVVTGDKRLVDRFDGRDLIVSVDLTDVKSGDRILQLTPETVNIELPNGIKLEEIQPNKIAVRLEKVEEKEVPIKVETEGNVAEGFEIYETNVMPAKARVRGAESFIKSLDSISTEKISIDNLKENYFARQIGLNIVNPKIMLLDTIVDANFRIGEKRIERMFIVSPKSDSELPKVSVVLFAPRSILDKIKAEDIEITLASENDKLVPKATLPADLQDKVEIKSVKKY